MNTWPQKSPSAKVKSAFIILFVSFFVATTSINSMALSSLDGDTSDPLDEGPVTNADTPFTPAAANSDFRLPYSDALGSGGQSWRGILSGTMQTTAPCVTYNQATQAGGSATTKGSIAIYESASEVAHALSVSASVGYKGMGARFSASSAFSSSSEQSSNSIYAVAHVHTNMGMVNLGQQTLLPEIAAMAKNINTIPEALSFISRCGDSYARGFTQGASWISIMRISTRSSSSATSLMASMSGRYMGFSGSASFGTSSSRVSSSSSFTTTEQCNGPLQCGEAGTISSGGVSYGYTEASSCDQNANSSTCHLNAFINNYQYMMKGGLAGACSSTTSTSTGQGSGLPLTDTSAAKCVVAVEYAPIADLAPIALPASAATRGDLASMDDELVITPRPPRILVTGSSSALPVENGQATIVITPAKKGGQPDSFLVTATASGASTPAGTCTADNSIVDTPNCTITGLANGVKYSFVAQALNEEGFSTNSNTVYSTPNALAVNPAVEPVSSAAVISAAANNVATSLDMANALEDTMSPAELIRAAAYGAYGVQRNLANWATEYQSILNAELENEDYNDSDACGAEVGSTSCADGTPARTSLVTQLGEGPAQTLLNHWQSNIRNLNRQAAACDRTYISTNPGCLGRATACWISSLDVTSYLNEECSPNAFATNGLLFIANPYTISDYMQGNKEIPPDVLEDATDALGDRAGVTFVTGSPLLAQAVSAGGDHTCTLQQDSTVRCWGNNNYGQLGNGGSNPFYLPVNPGLTGVRQISAGDGATCALIQDGTIRCWGNNAFGQIGDGTTTNRSVPTKVAGITNAVQVATSGNHTCAVLADGTVSCWGYNQYNQVGGAGLWSSGGNGTNSWLPVAVTKTAKPLSGVKSIALGGWHTCAILGDSSATCWGYGGDYQLGNSTNNVGYGNVMGGADKTMIDLGNRYGCAASSGSLWCWGRNDYGQIGNNSSNNTGTGFSYNIPLKVRTFAAGLAQHTCVVTSDSSVFCWGAGNSGQIGRGSVAPSGAWLPTPVVGLTNSAIAVSTGGYRDDNNGHSCAVLVDGSVQCWGLNTYGQLGLGNTTQQLQATKAVVFSS